MLQSAGHNTANTTKRKCVHSFCICYVLGLHCTALQRNSALKRTKQKSLNHIVSQLKSLCKLLRAMQNNCKCFVKWRKIFPVPENLWQATVHKPLIHTLQKGHTHGYWCFYAESVAYSNTEDYRVLDDYTVPLEILS